MYDVVKDIYALFDEEHLEVSDEWCEQLGNNIAKMLKGRLQEQQREYKLRMSSLGQGDRKLWYSVRESTPKESLRPETRIKFLYGDIIEEVYIALIRLAGHEVSKEQEEVELHGIKGHIDCLVDGKLVDIKSAASFSFNKFKDETLYSNDPFGYYAQLSAYSEAGDFEPAGWLVMDKQLGKLCFSKAMQAHLPDMGARAAFVKEMVKRDSEPEPCALPVADGKGGNMKLATTCSYCDFKKHCWRNSNGGQGLRTFIYSTGPRYLTEVRSLPKVQELIGE